MTRIALPIFCFALAIPSPGRAETVDPALPVVVTVGTPKSPAPVERLERARRGRSSVELPDAFVEVQRKSIGTMSQPPIVHADKSLTITLTSSELVRVAPDGSELFRVHLGSSSALRAPVLLPNGSIAVLTGAPSVVFVSDTGKILSTIALPRAAFAVQSPSQGLVEGIASIVPTEDGAVVVAANRSLLEIDASSRVRLKIALPERLASDVLPHADGWLVVGESGSVYRVRPPAEPRKIGVLGGLVPGTVALLDARTVVAHAIPNRIIALDLKSGATVARVGDSIFSLFDAPPAFDKSGNAWVTTVEGFLVGYDSSGAEIARAAAERTAVLPGAPMFPTARPQGVPMPGAFNRPAPIVDADGRVAFARSNGRFGIRSKGGQITSTDRACTTPIAIVPTAPRELVLACRDGSLVYYAAPPASP